MEKEKKTHECKERITKGKIRVWSETSKQKA